MDPVEKVVRVVAELPVRPFLARKRNGNGAYHVYLRFARGRGRAQHNAKGCCYLGSLTPLQLLAARQAIDRAWPRRCRRPKSEPFQTRLRALRVEYRAARQRLTVLARRAGYYLHGLSVRRMTMQDQVITDQKQAPDDEAQGRCGTHYRNAFTLSRDGCAHTLAEFEKGLYVMQRICTDLIGVYAGSLMDCAAYAPKEGTPPHEYRRMTELEERTVTSVCRLQETYIKLGEARLRLRGAHSPGIAA